MSSEMASASRQRMDLLLAEHATDMVTLHTPEGVYQYATPSSSALFGWEPDELVGRSAYDFFHPEDLAAITKSHVSILDMPDTYTVQYRLRCKDGGHKWVETTSRLIREGEGPIIEIIAITRDISERKRIEEERLEALRQASEAERHAVIADAQSRFVRAAAHELRTPLTSLKLRASVLLEWARRVKPEGAPNAAQFEKNLEEVVSLVNDLVEAAAVPDTTPTLAETDLSELLRLAAGGTAFRLQANADVAVRADSQRLERAMRSLFRQLGRITPDGADVRVERGERGAAVSIGPLAPPHDAVALTAALEPFGASHEDTGATTRYGVALHLAHAIVKAHGGSMRIDPGPLVVVEMPSDAA